MLGIYEDWISNKVALESIIDNSICLLRHGCPDRLRSISTFNIKYIDIPNSPNFCLGDGDS